MKNGERLEVAGYTYTRRDRQNAPGAWCYLRDMPDGRRVEVGLEAKLLLDEIVRLRGGTVEPEQTDYERKRALGYTDEQIRRQAGRRAP